MVKLRAAAQRTARAKRRVAVRCKGSVRNLLRLSLFFFRISLFQPGLAETPLQELPGKRHVLRHSAVLAPPQAVARVFEGLLLSPMNAGKVKHAGDPGGPECQEISLSQCKLMLDKPRQFRN